MTTGADIERELRRQQRERSRRGGPSTAALEALLWSSLVRHHPAMATNALVTAYGGEIARLTGIRARSKQRAMVTAARASQGSRLHLGGWGGFGDEADVAYALAAVEAAAEAQRHAALMALRGMDGGTTPDRRRETGFRDAVVLTTVAAAAGRSADETLEQVNLALKEAGFAPVSDRTLRRIRNKAGHVGHPA
jgi:hypothetical protein